MAFADLLIHTCNVKRYTSESTDAYGRPVKEWSDLHTNQPCRLTSTRGREVKQELEAVISDFKLFIPVLDVTERDRVEVNEAIYEVLLVQSMADGTDSHHLELSLQKVN